MLIIIDANTTLRKKLCDMLRKERIIPVDSVTAALEKICYFRTEINAVISNVDYLLEIFNRQTIKKVCNKLHLDEPAILGYYTPDNVKQKDELAALGAKYPLLECDEADLKFPDKYMAEIIKVYPELHYDMKKAYHCWTMTPDQIAAGNIDPRKWLQEHGFTEIIEQVEKEKAESPVIEDTILAIREMLEADSGRDKQNIDYKQLYLETKKQYDKLARYVRELIEKIR